MRKIMIVLVASLRWLTPWGGRGNSAVWARCPRSSPSMGTSVLGITPTSWAIGGSCGNWENRISSLMILSGTREFFDKDDFTGTKMAPSGPDRYSRVTDQGLKDHRLSSIRLVSPTA